MGTFLEPLGEQANTLLDSIIIIITIITIITIIIIIIICSRKEVNASRRPVPVPLLAPSGE